MEQTVDAAKKIVVVGGGKMGEAIMKGWISCAEGAAEPIVASNIQVVEPSPERRAFLTETHGVACVEDVLQADGADMVVIAIKPQVMAAMLSNLVKNEQLSPAGASAPLFVSIAAGQTTAGIEAQLGGKPQLVRVMPNMPLAVGAGASGVCGGAFAQADQVAYVAELFDCLGKAVVVDESQMDTVCALSGSGPAYVAAMIEAMRDAAVSNGLDAELAEALALQTVLGTAQLISSTNASVAQTRESICSPGGTTIAALEAMYAAGFDEVFRVGIDAAVARSKELASC